MLDTLGRLFVAAVLAGTPLLLGAIGEILTERAGNLKPRRGGHDVHGGHQRPGRLLHL